jgi:hypothetical protein
MGLLKRERTSKSVGCPLCWDVPSVTFLARHKSN